MPGGPPSHPLQSPFFDPRAEDAVNYGGKGGVIGHEITHGSDDAGRHFDAVDPHAPNAFRTNGPPSNMPEFARAFGCKAGDPMVRSEQERVQIW